MEFENSKQMGEKSQEDHKKLLDQSANGYR